MNVTHRASSNQRRGLQIHSTHRSPHPIRALLEEANERDFRSNQGIKKKKLEVSGYVGGGGLYNYYPESPKKSGGGGFSRRD